MKFFKGIEEELAELKAKEYKTESDLREIDRLENMKFIKRRDWEKSSLQLKVELDQQVEKFAKKYKDSSVYEKYK